MKLFWIIFIIQYTSSCNELQKFNLKTLEGLVLSVDESFIRNSSTLKRCIKCIKNINQKDLNISYQEIPINISKESLDELISLMQKLKDFWRLEERVKKLKEEAPIILKYLNEIDFLGLTQTIYGTKNLASEYQENLYFLCKEILENKKFSEIINFLQKIQISENKFVYDYATKTMLAAWAKLNTQKFVSCKKLEHPKPVFYYQESFLSKEPILNSQLFDNKIIIKKLNSIIIQNLKTRETINEQNLTLYKQKDELIGMVKNNQIIIWNIKNNSQFKINPKLQDEIKKIRFSNDKKKLIVWSKKTLKIFDLEKRKKFFRHDSNEEIFDAQIAKNGKILALLNNGLFFLEGICSKKVKEINKIDNQSKLIIKDDTVIIKFKNEIHTFKIEESQFKPIEQSNFNEKLTNKNIKKVKLLNYQYIGTLTADGILDLFDTILNKHKSIIYVIIADSSTLNTQTKISDKITSFTFSSDNEHLATGSFGGVVKIWKINKPQPECIFTFKAHQGPINSIKFSLDNKKIITTCKQKNSIKVFYSMPEKILEKCNPQEILKWENEIDRKKND